MPSVNDGLKGLQFGHDFIRYLVIHVDERHGRAARCIAAQPPLGDVDTAFSEEGSDLADDAGDVVVAHHQDSAGGFAVEQEVVDAHDPCNVVGEEGRGDRSRLFGRLDSACQQVGELEAAFPQARKDRLAWLLMSSRRLRVLRGTLVASLMAGFFVVPSIGSLAAARGGCDFNGDFFDDLAIGAPYEDVSGVVDAGAISILYGSAGGLAVDGAQFLHRGTSGIKDELGENDFFGHDLTCGDFNGDTFDDLAVGVGRDAVGSLFDAGSVHVIYGSSAGLSTSDEVIHQDSTGIQGTAEQFDAFGHAVASGDFDADGFDDLAITAPFEEYPQVPRGGTVTVIYGSTGGLDGDDEIWNQNSAGIKGIGENDDFFGYVLATGDFDGDGADDLAVGSPDEDVDTHEDGGAVNVIYGSGSGLTASGDQIWDRNSGGIKGVVATDDNAGLALATGDFDGDGRDDLAVGVPFANVDGVPFAGSLNVIYGSGSGLTEAGDQLFHQNTAGIGGTAENSDTLAAALTAGDFDGDGDDDLAAGIPRESVGSIGSAGAVLVIYGAGSELSVAGDQTWHQDSFGVKGQAEAIDFLGTPLSTGDFNGDRRADLVIGVPLEDRGLDADTGALAVLFGSSEGVSGTDQLWDQSNLQVAEVGDRFGFTGGGHNWFV